MRYARVTVADAACVGELRLFGPDRATRDWALGSDLSFTQLEEEAGMARRFHAAGLKLYLDIHYSDFWADPQHQDTPSAWAGQDLPTLAKTVQRYTRQVIGAFAAQGTPVDIVSIGNEVRNGILWPVGQLNGGGDQTAQWHAFGTLLKAGVAGARAATIGCG